MQSRCLRLSKPFRSAIPALILFALSTLLNSLAVSPASAQGPGVNLAQLVAAVHALQSQVAAQQNTINSLQETVILQQFAIKAQAAEIASLQEVTSPLSLQNGVGSLSELYITGVNVHIVNGLGATDGNPNDPADLNNDAVVNSLGNLIIGYNGLGNISGDVRTGSHNIIVGDENNYTSFGGLVAGFENSNLGRWSTISGGAHNFTLGEQSTISGGAGNIAFGKLSSVSGGDENETVAFGSSISGGSGNTTFGGLSSVSGGAMITEGDFQGWAAGGTNPATYHSP